MFKLLRKYNKLLLAIFGVLLMITFLIPQAISKFSQQSGVSTAVVATVGDGESVNGQTWHFVQREVAFLQKLPTRISFPGVESAQQLKPEHWYLLTREAEQAGLIGSGAALDLDENSLSQLSMMSGESPSFIRNTFAKIAGVGRMLEIYQGTGTLSDHHLMAAAKRLMNQVVAQVVVIEAKEADVQPTEEEITAQFAKYADVEPGTGEDGFGYRLPNRVKLEWLHIPVESVRESVRQSDDFSTVAQRLHWRRFENDAAKTFPKSESGPIPEVVRNDLLEHLTRQRLEEIAKFASDQLRLNRRGLSEQEGYVALPEDWDQRKLDFRALSESIRAKFNIELPAYESSGERWVAASELSTLGEVASATTEKFGSYPMNLTQLVEATREFKKDETAASTVFIQQDVAGPPLKASDGSVYVFRIIDADPTRAPEAVDEVREAVAADLKRIADYKRLADSASDIEREAEATGMLELALAHGTHLQPTATLSLTNRFILTQLAQAGQPAFVTPSNLPVVGQHRETVEAVLDYAAALPPDKAMGDLSQLSEEERVMVKPIPQKQALMVFRLMRISPLTREEYAEMVQKGTIQQLLASDEAGDGDPLKDAFGYDAILARNNFAFTRTRPEEGEGEDAASKTVADAR